MNRTFAFRPAILFFFLFATANFALADCPPKTTVSDTIYNADGSAASGRLVIAWPTFLIGPCQVVAGQTTVSIVNGALNVAIFPNDGAVPTGTSYRVTYYLKSGRVTTEYWVVPASPTPIALALVRTAAVPVPSVMFSESQVTNLIADLAKKVELPPVCPAGKFLQATASPPQVVCVDGTGAPLAGTSTSGTVKTDVDETDPRVYVKTTVDSLLAAKANLPHTHDAAALTSGILDPARLPVPTSTSLGGVRSGTCTGTDKVTGISTAGAILCGVDETGGGGSLHKVNGTNVADNSVINFEDSATISWSNPSAGNLKSEISDSSITAAKLAVAFPSAAQLSGLGDANISSGSLSPDRIVGTAEVVTNKGAAGGYAALDGLGKVVQDPASAQTTPAAGKIPLADGAGKLADGWLGANVSLLGQAIDLASEVEGILPAYRGGTGIDSSGSSGVARVSSGTWSIDASLNHLGGALTGATTFTSDATSETVTFSFESAFTSGNQFLIRQQTGNPTGGTLFGIVVNDADVKPLVVNDGTSDVLTVLRNGVLDMSTGFRIAGGASSGRFLKGDGTNFTVSSGSASGTGSCTNQFVRVLNSDGAPTCATVDTEDVSSSIVTTSGTQTLTNKTLDAEGTGNSITTVSKVYFTAAGCDNATAAPAWDLPTSSAAGKACIGSAPRYGVLTYADGSTTSAYTHIRLPSDWTGNVDLVFLYAGDTSSTNNIVWQPATACVADGEDLLNPTFNTTTSATGAGPTTAGQRKSLTFSSITTTGCATGETLVLRVQRLGGDGSDAYTGVAQLVAVEMTLRRAQ